MMDLKHLPNAKPNEQVQLFLRRHWSAPLEIFIYTFFLFLIPLVGALYFSENLTVWLDKPFISHLIILAASVYALAIWLFAFLEFTDYYLDIWIVTNERIINIEQKGLFTRVASELHLSAIEDATSEVKGIVHTFLDYGNVHIQTAGERTRFIFKNIPHPEQVKEKVIWLINSCKMKHDKDLVNKAAEAMK